MSEQNTVAMADIAREAGLSMSSVSRALSGKPGVSAATVARVREIADRMSYVVSPEASGLSRRSTGRIGVVTMRVGRWFFGEAIEGVQAVLAEQGLDTLLYCVADRDERARFFEELPARRKVDGVVVVGIPVSAVEQTRLELLDVAVVATGGQSAAYPYVSIDDEAAGRQAVDHLLFLGHRRIAMIDAIDPHEAEWPVELRARAYHRALAEAGLATDPDLYVRVPWGPSGGVEGMERLLSLREPPTAVFAHSDEIAFGALQVIRKAGLRVPQDISVVGLDDEPVAQALDLTTVHQDARRQGELAARRLVAQIKGEPGEHVTLVPTRLVVRGSTGAPRAAGARTA